MSLLGMNGNNSAYGTGGLHLAAPLRLSFLRRITPMVSEEVGSKFVRLFYFVGAGVICAKAINMWRDYEHKQAIAAAAEKLNGTSQTTAGTVNEAPVKS